MICPHDVQGFRQGQLTIKRLAMRTEALLKRDYSLCDPIYLLDSRLLHEGMYM